jgi:hypothetical protein
MTGALLMGIFAVMLTFNAVSLWRGSSDSRIARQMPNHDDPAPGWWFLPTRMWYATPALMPVFAVEAWIFVAAIYGLTRAGTVGAVSAAVLMASIVVTACLATAITWLGRPRKFIPPRYRRPVSPAPLWSE